MELEALETAVQNFSIYCERTYDNLKYWELRSFSVERLLNMESVYIGKINVIYDFITTTYDLDDCDKDTMKFFYRYWTKKISEKIRTAL